MPAVMKRQEREWLRRLYVGFNPFAKAGAFERWLEYVQEIEVELHPGGRATLIHPEMGITVEIRFAPEMDYRATSYKVEAPPGQYLPQVEISMSYFVGALGLALGAEDSPDTSAPLPAAGKAPSLGFYRALIAEYDQLLRAGHRSPVSELSRRYKAKPGTVKSWLSRGREYLKGEQR